VARNFRMLTGAIAKAMRLTGTHPDRFPACDPQASIDTPGAYAGVFGRRGKGPGRGRLPSICGRFSPAGSVTPPFDRRSGAPAAPSGIGVADRLVDV